MSTVSSSTSEVPNKIEEIAGQPLYDTSHLHGWEVGNQIQSTYMMVIVNT